jgi:hypothetical protein
MTPLQWLSGYLFVIVVVSVTALIWPELVEELKTL